MAKQHIVRVNKPMMDALRKMLLRSDECPLCGEGLSVHSWFRFTDKGKLIACSKGDETF
jgi:hypothetical protein